MLCNFNTFRKKSEKLDWMYSAPGQLNREEYLLGKAIDKAVDPLAQDKQVVGHKSFIIIAQMPVIISCTCTHFFCYKDQ